MTNWFSVESNSYEISFFDFCKYVVMIINKISDNNSFLLKHMNHFRIEFNDFNIDSHTN